MHNFDNSRIKEIADAAQERVNINRNPGESKKIALETKALAACTFVQLLQTMMPSSIYNDLRPSLVIVFTTLAPELFRDNIELFTRMQKIFRADLQDIKNNG